MQEMEGCSSEEFANFCLLILKI